MVRIWRGIFRPCVVKSIAGNEEAVGRAIRDSGIPRSEVFVTTKLVLVPTHSRARLKPTHLYAVTGTTMTPREDSWGA
jgi:uncharacterized membrane protein YjjP (DUF1212 family)